MGRGLSTRYGLWSSLTWPKCYIGLRLNHWILDLSWWRYYIAFATPIWPLTTSYFATFVILIHVLSYSPLFFGMLLGRSYLQKQVASVAGNIVTCEGLTEICWPFLAGWWILHELQKGTAGTTDKAISLRMREDKSLFPFEQNIFSANPLPTEFAKPCNATWANSHISDHSFCRRCLWNTCMMSLVCTLWTTWEQRDPYSAGGAFGSRFNKREPREEEEISGRKSKGEDYETRSGQSLSQVTSRCQSHLWKKMHLEVKFGGGERVAIAYLGGGGGSSRCSGY